MAGIHWLKRDRNVERALRWLGIFVFALSAVLVVAGLAVYVWLQHVLAADPGAATAAEGNRIGLLLLGGCIGLLLLGPVVFPFARAVLQRQVGVDGRNIVLRLHDGRSLTIPPERMAYTPQALFYKSHSFPLRNRQGRSLYQKGEIETHLEPLLQQSRLLNQWQALAHQWKHRDTTLLWPLAAAAALAFLGLLILLAVGR